MKKLQVLIIVSLILLTICAVANFHVARADVIITQPINVAMINSAPPATVFITGGGADLSPSTFAADGTTHSIAMDLGVSFTLSFSNSGDTQDGFNVASAFSSTSSSYTASTAELDVTAYEQVSNTFSETGVSGEDSVTLSSTCLGTSTPIVLNSVNSWSATVWTDSGTAVTFPVSSHLSTGTEQWSIGIPVSLTLTTGGITYSQAYVHQFYVTVVSAHGSPSQSSQWVNAGSDFSTTVTSPSDVVSATSQWVTSQPTLSITGVESAQTLTFSWTEQFYVTVASTYGTPTAVSQWVDSGQAFSTSVAGQSPFTIGTGEQAVVSSDTLSIASVTAPQTLTFQWTEQFLLTVNSAHGTPSGAGWYGSGSLAYAGLSSGTVAGSAGSQYVFTSWSSDASGSAFSSSNAVTMNGPKTATANWKIQYQVTFAVSVGGSTSPTGSNVWENAGSLPIAATPNSGYNFSSWSSNTGSITFNNANSATATAMISGTGTITATFAIDTFAITVSQGDHGTISPGTTTVNYGGSQDFSFTPVTGYHIVAVIVNGTTVATASPYTILDVTGPTSLIAEYAINTYAITVSQGDHGTISPGTNIVDYGDTPIFSIAPNTGYHIASIAAEGNPVAVTSPEGQSYQFNAISASTSLTATFAINTCPLTINVGANGQSNIASQTVNWDSVQNFVFTPNTGYNVADVVVNGTIDEGTVSSLSLTVTGDTSVDVSFAINTYTITVTQSANGQIAPATTNVNYSNNQTFTITPDTGYYLTSLTVDGSPVTVASSYTFSNVEASHIITATFAATATPTPTPTSTPTPTPTPAPTSTPTATFVQATTESSATVDLPISGNITSPQISNVEITTNQSAITTTISFTVTGVNGTTGFGNMTIPKTDLPYGTTPTIYVDGQPAQNQGYTQDNSNYYLWYTIHFSTHQITIVFVGKTNVTPTPTSTQTPAMASMDQYIAVIVAAIILGAVVIGVFIRRRKRANFAVRN